MQHAHYIRLYTDEHAESHFEDLEIDLAPVDFAPPTVPLNIARYLPSAQNLWIDAPPGWAGEELHPSPQRQIFCTLKGEYKVSASDGAVRFLPVGSVLLLDDIWGKGHSTTIISEEEVLIFGMVLAEDEA